MSREGYAGFLESLASYRGYTTTSYQEEDTPGDILGATEFAFGIFARPKIGIAATQPLAGTISFAGSSGWQISVAANGGSFQWDSHDGSGNLFSAVGHLYDPILIRPKWHCIVVRQYSSGGVTNADVFVNGSRVGTGAAPASGATILGANPFRIGFNSSFNDIADFCDIGPVAYIGAPVTEVNLLLGIDAAMKRRSFIADSINGINWSNVWIPRVGEGSTDRSYFTRTGLTDLVEVGSGLARTSPQALYA